MQRIAVIVLILSLPATATAEAISDVGMNPLPARQGVDLRIQDQDTRALQQIKGAVCGTGPIYAGTVDDPIFVKPLFNPSCTIASPTGGPR